MTNVDREFFIFGEPLETELGKVRFLTYKEYLLNIAGLSLMSLNVLHIYYQYRKLIDKKDENALNAIESIKEERLYNLVVSTPDFLETYMKIFYMVYEEKGNIAKIFEDEESFMKHRNLVLEMNMLQEDEVSPNPEIQKGIEMSRKIKSNSGEKQTPTDIITSIVAGTPNSFKDVCEMTVLQVYSIFYRLGAFKSYDTTTLFATVSSEAKIEPWSKNIDLFEKQTSGIKKKDFDKTYGGLLK